MAQQELETVVKNLDARVQRIEQILPTLATKDDLTVAVAPLATREEMREAIQAATAPLATREEMHAAIQAATAPLATREEMREAIQAATAPLATREAIEPLATRAEMHTAIRDEGERTRRHFDVVADRLEGNIRLIAEGHIALNDKVDALRVELKGDISALDRRVTRLEADR